ncbi:MAG: MFS transporter [archaeon]
MGLRTLAISLVAIFVPIYFLSELGFTLTEVFTYLLIWTLLVIVSSPIVAKITAKIGFKRTMFLSVPLTVVYMILLYMMKGYNIHYFWIALLGAVSMELFWMGFHIDFAQNSHKKKRAEEVSTWFSILLAVGVIGPLLGSVIIKFIGFKTLFVIASILMVLAVIPLMFTDTKKAPKDFKLKKAIFNKKYKKEALLYAAYGIKEMADSVFWPLFIFLTIKDVVSVGMIISVVALISAIYFPIIGKMIDLTNDKKSRTFVRLESLISGVSWPFRYVLNIFIPILPITIVSFIGRVKDNKKPNRIRGFVRLGALIDGVSWPFRYVLTTFFPMLSITIISFLAFALVDIPLYKKFYDEMHDTTEYVVMREVSMYAGKAILVLVVMALGFKGGFWLMGLSNLAYLLM